MLKSTPISAHPRENRARTGPGWDEMGMSWDGWEGGTRVGMIGTSGNSNPNRESRAVKAGITRGIPGVELCKYFRILDDV